MIHPVIRRELRHSGPVFVIIGLVVLWAVLW